MQQRMEHLYDFIKILENRRENETLACTTNKLVMIIRDVIDAMQDMNNEIQSLREQIQNQQPVVQMVEEKKEEVKEIIHEESGLPLDSFNQLQEWNNNKTAKVLYHSDSITTKKFNEIVGGHQNVCIVIKTKDNHIFGTFSSKLRVPKNMRDDDFDVVDDDKYYFYTLKNSLGMNPTIFKKKKTMYTIARFSSQNESVIFEAENCFTLATATGVSYVISSFKDSYVDVPEEYLKLFNGSNDSSFAMASIHIIEFK